MAGINRQGMVSINGTVCQHVTMYMSMYLSVKIRGGLNTVLANLYEFLYSYFLLGYYNRLQSTARTQNHQVSFLIRISIMLSIK